MLKRTLPVMFREATQGDKELRDLSNLSQFLPALLNPSLKSYFETLTPTRSHHRTNGQSIRTC